MQSLFSASGIHLSFLRQPMGASDLALSNYTYDDLPPGKTDPADDAVLHSSAWSTSAHVAWSQVVPGTSNSGDPAPLRQAAMGVPSTERMVSMMFPHSRVSPQKSPSACDLMLVRVSRALEVSE
jgi:hypothetical protein